ncbi:hypothetical protein E2562_030322 [Oryza meyeriana var. granulata]|uniref:Uncharacterized protein n=1 Tax=Oryza meyeriana var. granulata TaxID=110450 RepID=A0A6G1F004_9ORYZ|nr:hypothetical protein E2562_030322 [Oryza meyeriana var. granulata]
MQWSTLLEPLTHQPDGQEPLSVHVTIASPGATSLMSFSASLGLFRTRPSQRLKRPWSEQPAARLTAAASSVPASSFHPSWSRGLIVSNDPRKSQKQRRRSYQANRTHPYQSPPLPTRWEVGPSPPHVAAAGEFQVAFHRLREQPSEAASMCGSCFCLRVLWRRHGVDDRSLAEKWHRKG